MTIKSYAAYIAMQEKRNVFNSKKQTNVNSFSESDEMYEGFTDHEGNPEHRNGEIVHHPKHGEGVIKKAWGGAGADVEYKKNPGTSLYHNSRGMKSVKGTGKIHPNHTTQGGKGNTNVSHYTGKIIDR